MQPFLRVCTSDNALYQQLHQEEDVSRRMIRRTFAFDEWDEEDDSQEQDIELFRTIHRSDAFDEWDEDERSGSGGQHDNPTQQRIPQFVPVPKHGDDNHIATVSPFLQPFGTKFDIDDTTPPAVTPSPPKNSEIERPIPLYSHQQLLPMKLFTIPNSNPTPDYSLEGMLRASFEPSFPLVCDGIPRQASAFSIPIQNSRKAEEEHWFDKYGSGTTLFEDDDYIFESPTSDEDSLTIPKVIVCHHTTE